LTENQTDVTKKLNEEKDRVVAQNKQLSNDLRSMKLERDHFKELNGRQNTGNSQSIINKLTEELKKVKQQLASQSAIPIQVCI
jgi:hypothetical protein